MQPKNAYTYGKERVRKWGIIVCVSEVFVDLFPWRVRVESPSGKEGVARPTFLLPVVWWRSLSRGFIRGVGGKGGAARGVDASVCFFTRPPLIRPVPRPVCT